MVAIVGENGSGKTSLLKVMGGLLEPDAGQVVVDGCPLRVIDKASYRRMCGFVFQRSLLIDRTIRETISYRLDSMLDDAAAFAALEKTGLAAFVSKLQDGLDTMVGELGSQVSGGELQRLGITRELIYRPSVLFLDESTSSVDKVAERSIFSLLREVCKETAMTTIFVAHGLSTLDYADFVYVMQSGEVVSAGTLTEVRKSPFFESLFASQLGAKCTAGGLEGIEKTRASMS